jgi:hypothetical protein
MLLGKISVVLIEILMILALGVYVYLALQAQE